MSIDPTQVSLRPITADTVRDVIRLAVNQNQEHFVAPNAVSLAQVIEHVRAKELFASLTVSYVPGPGCPEKFYLGHGFLATGKVDGGELVLELPFCRSAA